MSGSLHCKTYLLRNKEADGMERIVPWNAHSLLGRPLSLLHNMFDQMLCLFIWQPLEKVAARWKLLQTFPDTESTCLSGTH